MRPKRQPTRRSVGVRFERAAFAGWDTTSLNLYCRCTQAKSGLSDADWIQDDHMKSRASQIPGATHTSACALRGLLVAGRTAITARPRTCASSPMQSHFVRRSDDECDRQGAGLSRSSRGRRPRAWARPIGIRDARARASGS